MTSDSDNQSIDFKSSKQVDVCPKCGEPLKTKVYSVDFNQRGDKLEVISAKIPHSLKAAFLEKARAKGYLNANTALANLIKKFCEGKL